MGSRFSVWPSAIRTGQQLSSSTVSRSVISHGAGNCPIPNLTARFRLIAYDMRGHGGSDKPLEAERYNTDKLWADDLAAVVAAANVQRPVLVYGHMQAGSSLIICDFTATTVLPV